MEAQREHLIKYNKQSETCEALNRRIIELEDINLGMKKELERALSENDNETIKAILKILIYYNKIFLEILKRYKLVEI